MNIFLYPKDLNFVPFKTLINALHYIDSSFLRFEGQCSLDQMATPLSMNKGKCSIHLFNPSRCVSFIFLSQKGKTKIKNKKRCLKRCIELIFCKAFGEG
jgi:hypothetical protein